MPVEDQVIRILTDKRNRSFFKEQKRPVSVPADFEKNCLITLNQIETLIEKAIKQFMKEPTLLEIQAPVNICGDIHGQFLDLLWIFGCSQYPPYSNYLFLGDYVDRGLYSLETLCLLLSFKIKYPNRFFLLRGNHESNPVNEHHTFFAECSTRFNENLWHHFGQLFNWLPVAAIVGRKIFCVHAGLSPDFKSLDQIRQIRRPIITPGHGLLCDLIWSDPDQKLTGWALNEGRHISYRFGADAIAKFLRKTKLSMVVRGHELMKNGYEIFANGLLISIFSAPNYNGVFKNDGAILIVDKNLDCTVQVLKYADNKQAGGTFVCDPLANLFPRRR